MIGAVPNGEGEADWQLRREKRGKGFEAVTQPLLVGFSIRLPSSAISYTGGNAVRFRQPQNIINQTQLINI
jgi:hypothetical protein